MLGMTAQDIYGTAPVSPGSVVNQTAMSSTDGLPTGLMGLVNPRNPLFWVGAVVLATVGAAGLAGSVRLGPAKLSGSIGKST